MGAWRAQNINLTIKTQTVVNQNIYAFNKKIKVNSYKFNSLVHNGACEKMSPANPQDCKNTSRALF